MLLQSHLSLHARAVQPVSKKPPAASPKQQTVSAPKAGGHQSSSKPVQTASKPSIAAVRDHVPKQQQDGQPLSFNNQQPSAQPPSSKLQQQKETKHSNHGAKGKRGRGNQKSGDEDDMQMRGADRCVCFQTRARHTQVNTHAHTHAHTHTQTPSRTHARPHTHTHIHTHTHTHTQTHTHTHTDTQTHTYIHTHPTNYTHANSRSNAPIR